MNDVIVIGGGPAGSTAAARLASLGHDVLLFEREKFPREHVGESLLPFCYRLFLELGVVDRLKQMFVRKPGVRFIDRDGVQSTFWCFKHVLQDPSYLSFQVIRSEFDDMLLRNAERLGAVVREETRVVAVDLTSAPDRVGVTSVDGSGREETRAARFLVDASGRDAFVGAMNGWRKPREELDRTSLWSHWDGVVLRHGLEQGLSLIIYMGQEKRGWIWVFPLGPDRVTAGFVAQNSYIRSERKRLQEQGSTDWKQDLLMQELLMSGVVKELLDGTRLLMPVLVNGDYSYEVRNHHGSNYCMVGDARGFIDPIFSSGVFLSMKSAFLVAPAIDAQLRGAATPGDNPGLATAYTHITGAYNFVHRMIRMFYNPHSVTWAAVGAEGEAHKAHESALAAGHYMLSGDFFENYEKYDKFFELLEDPKNFHRYRHLVIERPELNRPDCATRPDEIFGDMLAEDRRRRGITPTGERLFDRLDFHAETRPDARAVEGSGGALTYGQLAARSRAVADHLTRRGIGRGARIAVFAPRTAELVAALYGILRAGAAYVPLGIDWPAERVAWVIRDVAPAAILTDRASAALLPAERPPVLWIGSDEVAADPLTDSPGTAATSEAVAASDLAYILYTSGSTGRPKGVMHSHESALAFVRWAADELGLNAGDRLASHAPFHFDLSIFDLYAASYSGAAAVLPDEDVAAMPALFVDWLGERRITTTYSVPGLWVAALGGGRVSSDPLSSLRRIIYAGEPMAPKYVFALQQALPAAIVYNFYGPTETNVCTAYEVPPLDPGDVPAAIPIGTACSGDAVTVEDGELVVRGESLLLGYWGASPRGRDEPYRTGDLVRFDEKLDGLVFVGRRDGMRKVRGFRVELGEIEACLLRSPAVAEAVAAVDQRDPDHAAVVAFVVPAAGARRDGMALRRHCALSLPPYMIPRVIWRDDIPRTTTGKTDRTALEQTLGAGA